MFKMCIDFFCNIVYSASILLAHYLSAVILKWDLQFPVQLIVIS